MKRQKVCAFSYFTYIIRFGLITTCLKSHLIACILAQMYSFR